MQVEQTSECPVLLGCVDDQTLQTERSQAQNAGKLNHSGADQLSGSDYSLVDYNRAGQDPTLPFLQSLCTNWVGRSAFHDGLLPTSAFPIVVCAYICLFLSGQANDKISYHATSRSVCFSRRLYPDSQFHPQIPLETPRSHEIYGCLEFVSVQVCHYWRLSQTQT